MQKKLLFHIFFLQLANRYIIFSLKNLIFCKNFIFRPYFCLLNTSMRKGKDPEPDPYLMDSDPDPGGPKTCGSKSPTLLARKAFLLAYLLGMFLLRRSLQQKQLTPQAMIIMSEAETAPTISSSFRLIWQFLPANQALQLHDTCTQQGGIELSNKCKYLHYTDKKVNKIFLIYKEI
jgi:hypothetical protein